MLNTTNARVMVTYSDDTVFLTSDLKPENADYLARLMANAYRSRFDDPGRVVRTVATVDGELVSVTYQAEAEAEAEAEATPYVQADTLDRLVARADETGLTIEELLDMDDDIFADGDPLDDMDDEEMEALINA